MELFEGKNVSTVGKLFLAGIAAWVLGKKTNLKLKGTPEQIECIKSCLLATKAFHDELYKPGVTVQALMEKLQHKRNCAAEFEKCLKLPWPI